MSLELRSVVVERGGVEVVRGVSLAVPRGGTLAVLGPSGSGKSSLLLAVAGLVDVTAGTVLVDDRDVAGVPPEQRSVGLMFQEFALFPHLSVAENVAYGPRMSGVARADRAAVATALLDRVGLAGLGDRDVATLSGGQRQRVALARSLATDPSVLLLDEPLGALDRQLREELLVELRELLAGGPAVVAVTHDRDEAFGFGDRVAVVRAGRIAQLGTPDELWTAPRDAWTASFLGHDNVLRPAQAAGLGLRLDHGSDAVLVPTSAVHLDGPHAGRVTRVTWRSGRRRVVVDVDGASVTVELEAGTAVTPGDTLSIGVDVRRVRVLGRQGSGA